MNQVWLPLECSQPDLRLWSLNVIALVHSENKKKISSHKTTSETLHLHFIVIVNQFLIIDNL